MLLNCPKCGFSQPQDRYCAKCGVDMENFQPRQTSLLSRILLHPALHISAIVILVLIAVTFIKVKNRQKQSFLAQVEQMQNGPVVLEREQPGSKVESLAPIPTATASQTPELVVSNEDPNLKMANASEAAVSNNSPTAGSLNSKNFIAAPGPSVLGTTATESEAAAEKKPKAVIKVRVFYAEVSVATIDRWSARMQSTGQFQNTDFRMGVLPNIEQEINSDRSIVILDRVEKRFEQSPSLEWSVGRTSRDQFVGLKTNLGLKLTEQESLRGEIKVTRQIETTDPRTFEADFEAPPKAGWVFADLLPHQYRLDPEDEISPKSIFKIFNSPRFKNLTTQFTLLFVFDRN